MQNDQLITCLIIAGVCTLCITGFIIIIWKSHKEKYTPDEYFLFLKIQGFINRSYSDPDIKRAEVKVNDFIERYGTTPYATRLQMQLQNKRIILNTGGMNIVNFSHN